MAYRSEPSWVSGRIGSLCIEPPITHPAFCTCDQCPAYRAKRAARTGRPIDDVQAEPIDIRIKRHSPYPRNKKLSKLAALQVKEAEEKKLKAGVVRAKAAEVKEASIVRFLAVTSNYRRYLIDNNKDYDHAKSRIDAIEAFFGPERDVETLEYPLYQELLAEVGCMSAETQRHYANMLLAMLNRAKAQRIITRHHLEGVPIPQVVHDDEPEPWSRRELAVLMGPALREYEREQSAWNAQVAQEKKNRGLRSPSYIPLRGLCLLGYYTMMRPKCNRFLTWEELTLDAANRSGWYQLDKHKNVNKGIKARGPLAAELVDYLATIRPPNGCGPVHLNPSTGEPYVDIRKQWYRLLEITSRMLGYDLEGKKGEFFNLRHTGASDIARRGKTPAHLLAVVKMMGDTSVATVNKHYFNIELDLMQEMVLGWERPDVPVPPSASLTVFGAEQTPICDVPLALAS
jgi:integrase